MYKSERIKRHSGLINNGNLRKTLFINANANLILQIKDKKIR